MDAFAAVIVSRATVRLDVIAELKLLLTELTLVIVSLSAISAFAAVILFRSSSSVCVLTTKFALIAAMLAKYV